MLAQGICPEQARMILPQSMMTEWVETGSLAAAARIYNQRTDSHAQIEIQDLANRFGDCVEDIAPISWGCLT
jgi:thymidylate synthase (FAD)